MEFEKYIQGLCILWLSSCFENPSIKKPEGLQGMMGLRDKWLHSYEYQFSPQDGCRLYVTDGLKLLDGEKNKPVTNSNWLLLHSSFPYKINLFHQKTIFDLKKP